MKEKRKDWGKRRADMREYSKKYYQENKAKRDAVNRAYVKANPEKLSEYRARVTAKRRGKKQPYNLKKLGWTLEEWHLAMGLQSGLCDICDIEFGSDGPGSKACADHDHLTGKARAIICARCNKALGLFKDRPDVMRRAAAYVETDHQVVRDGQRASRKTAA